MQPRPEVCAFRVKLCRNFHTSNERSSARIKVWSLDEQTGTWSVEDDWKAHDAPVSKISWAHPEFGTIIASSSFDRTVKVWEQSVQTASEQQQSNNAGAGPVTSRWVERAVLPDARGTVRHVEFAPHHFGLKLVRRVFLLSFTF